ncbi:MAG: Xylose isomerase domain protein barrel [Actinomycetia bacterium]|nr:Xylose isomerase domain protein barrel [Actinomycetes bacterium]
MLIGAMNHPKEDVAKEVEWMAELGLEFIDLTLEPPCAAVWRINISEIRKAVTRHGLRVVGHTAYYLPFCSPFESLRNAAVGEMKACLEAFAEIGAKCINIHPDRHAPMHDRKFIIDGNIRSLEELIPAAGKLGLEMMIENLPGSFNTVHQLGELLDPLPELGLHLDIGHSNLMVEHNSASEILAKYGNRLRHVHLHDNKGGNADLHLPLGTGTLKVEHELRALKASGYNETITLEVFSDDRHYLAYSRDRLRAVWEGIPG